MKKIISAIIVLSMVMLLAYTSIDANPTLVEQVQEVQLTSAELFMSANILRGSDKGYELDRALNRIEGIVMLIRMLGVEEDALAYDGQDLAFDDIPQWGLKYIDYAYDMALIRGVNEREFRPKDSIHYYSFCTLMLRTLGYSEEAGDFDWFTAADFASDLDIGLAKDFTKNSFTRNDAVDVMMKTLNAPLKGESQRLIDRLVEEKKMDDDIAQLIDVQLFVKYQVSGPNSSIVLIEEPPLPTTVPPIISETEDESPSDGYETGGGSQEDESDGEAPEPGGSVTDPVVTDPVIPTPVINEPDISIIRASEFGMVAKDANAGKKNAELLNEAINTYGKLVIDDVYYIGDGSESVDRKDIELIGENQGELVFDISRTKILFGSNVINNISISNIKFTNITSEEVIIVYSRDDEPTYIESAVFDQCVFTGDISAFRQKGNKYTNPNTTKFGIGSFIFRNNRVTNTHLTFLIFIDLPFNEIVISNNNIHNFQHTFANISLSNGIKYGEDLRKMRNFIRVNNNTVINDDDWWADDGGLYHAFVLAENNEIIYKNNHVEGLKADFDIALYDAYLSCLDVTYINNTWINNICFASGKNNTLIKAKSGYDGNRLYQGNTFIVEEEYAERLGQSKKNLYVQFIDINQSLESFKIIDNRIDVYDLRFQTSSRDVQHYVFNDNRIEATYASGKMFIPRLIDEHQSSITFNGNYIDIDQDEYRWISSTDSHNRFGLIEIVDKRTNDSSKAIDLVMKDNYIKAPITYGLHDPICESALVSGNELFVVESLFKGFSYGGNQPDLESVEVSFQ